MAGERLTILGADGTPVSRDGGESEVNEISRQITLWIEGPLKEPSLSKIEFIDPAENRHAGLYRGQRVPSHGKWSTFVWSKAVRAVTVLLLRKFFFPNDPERGILQGDKGSLASSLDYAMTKQPEWLVDLFGQDASGRSRFARFVEVMNPSRKRPGPVVIALKPSAFSAGSIRVFFRDGTVSPEILHNLDCESAGGMPELQLAPPRGSSPSSIGGLVERMDRLPAAPERKVLDGYRAELSKRSTPIIVLEDDAAGLQLVSGIPSILESTPENLEWLIEEASVTRIGFITHPSRGHEPDTAARLFFESSRRLASMIRRRGDSVTWSTRMDSCLRGHNRIEMNSVKRALRESDMPQFDLEVFAPAFLPAGRITFEGHQLIRRAEQLELISQTEYSQQWEGLKQSSRVMDFISGTEEECVEYTCDLLRSNSPAKLAEMLSQLPRGSHVVLDSIEEADSIVGAYALYLAELRGLRILYRSAPSLLVSMVGLSPEGFSASEHFPFNVQVPDSKVGMIVAGSLSSLTKLQLRALSDREDVVLVGIDPEKLRGSRAAHLDATVNRCISLLNTGFIPLITTRLWEDVVQYPSTADRDLVLDALAEVLRRVGSLPQWVVLKGSDTCFHVLRWGVGAKRLRSSARFPEGGTLTRILDAECALNQKPIVLFPGNVGEDYAMHRVVERLVSST